MTAVGLRNRHGVGVRGGSHTFTETAYEFTGGRRGRYGRGGGGASSGETSFCCGFLVGLVFFAASTFLLWWNEGEAVAVYTSLKEARDAEEVAERMEKMHVKRDKEKKKNVRTMLGVRHSATVRYRSATVRY